MSRGPIANLHAALSWDLDDFDRGTGHIESALGNLRNFVGGVGDSFLSAGRNLTKMFTLPVAGAAAGVTAAAISIAGDAKQIRASAQLAGEGAEDFQRLSHAANNVGIGSEKLGDIFKDTRDKIGDFIATGGGEMADFFEKIGPQVGVTAESFAGLGGKDSLQLFYNSLEQANVSAPEMVFYLESIADEATGLIPLLRENGKGFEELGKSALVLSPEDIERFTRFRKSIDQLKLAFTRFVLALGESGIIDKITAIINKVSGFISRLAETQPWIVNFVAGLALAVAAIGPLVSVLSVLVITLMPLFIARFGPIFAILSAVINPLGTAIVFFGKFAGQFISLAGVISNILPFLGRMLLLLVRAHPITAALVTIFTLFGDNITEALGRVWETAQRVLGPALQQLFAALGAAFDRLKQAFTDLSNSQLGKLLREIGEAVGWLIEQMVEMAGNRIIYAFRVVIDLITMVVDSWTAAIDIITALINGDWSAAWDLAAQVVGNNIIRMSQWVGWFSESWGKVVKSFGVSLGGDADILNAPPSSRGDDDASDDAGGSPFKLPSFSGGAAGKSSARRGPSPADLAAQREALALEQKLAVARASGDVDTERALQRQIDLNRMIDQYKRAGLSDAAARLAAERDMAELEAARAIAQEAAIEAAEEEFDILLAQMQGDQTQITYLEDQRYLRERIAFWQDKGLSLTKAQTLAELDANDLIEARRDSQQQRLQRQRREFDLELARRRGDDPSRIFALEDGLAREDRVQELVGLGVSPEEAQRQALSEGAELARADLTGVFRDTFKGGIQAALDGNLGDFFTNWLKDASFNALNDVLNKLADNLADLLFNNQGGGSGGGGGLLSGIGGLLGGLFGGGSGGGGGGLFSGVSGSGFNLDAGAASKINLKGLPGFNTGGQFRIGGNSGIDQNVLSINSTPVARVSSGEIMNIQRGGSAASGGGKMLVEIVDTTGLFETRTREVATNVAAPMAQQAAVAGAQGAQLQARQRARRRLGGR